MFVLFKEMGLKIKLLLRFYFFADGLETAINNRIMKRACSPCADGLESAEYICALISEKSCLCSLWGYLDEIISALPAADAEWLNVYAAGRGGFGEWEMRNIKRAVMKFVRKARGAERFGEAIALAGKYGCYLSGRK